MSPMKNIRHRIVKVTMMKITNDALRETVWLYNQVLQGRFGTKERSALLMSLENIINLIKDDMSKVGLINLDELRTVDSITRVEVIDHSEDGCGKEYSKWDEKVKIELDLQDEGRTLKVFISDRK